MVDMSEKTHDTWVNTFCDGCYATCGMRAHVVGGIAMKLEGDPEFPLNGGKLCAKGHAAIMSLYDPNRLKVPLRRTNGQKGIGINPGWAEISWEEALDIISEKLRAVRQKDPQGLVLGGWDHPVGAQLLTPWGTAFGTPYTQWMSSNYFCGNALHQMAYVTNGSFHCEVDLDYCNYCILFGNQHGFMVGVNPNLNAQKMAEARMRGMKLVVIDPVCSNAASKADEWIPIRPGTDGALALGMANVLLNELGVYDADFIAKRTNGPYLVGPDGHYVRDPGSSKPLVWDMECHTARPYDECNNAPALEGTFEVLGRQAQPAFQLLKEKTKEFPPEVVGQITGVSPDTVRRLAREFGDAAHIGSSISIGGFRLPYRPAATNQYRGSTAHRYGTQAALAVQVLNLLVGNMNMPGGHRGMNLIGPDGQWEPRQADGLIVSPSEVSHYNPYEWKVGAPLGLDMKGVFPLAHGLTSASDFNFGHEDRFKVGKRIAALILCRNNPLMNRTNPKVLAGILASTPFLVYFTMHLDEVSDFADIVLPDTHFLERTDFLPHRLTYTVSPSSGHWYWALRQRVVPPAAQARNWRDVLTELAHRIGIASELYTILNVQLKLNDENKLNPEGNYTWDEIFDRMAKSTFGPEHGLQWFQRNAYIKQPRKVNETYPGPFLKVRHPIYYEHFLKVGKELEAHLRETGMPWDASGYQPLPDWKPCSTFEKPLDGYDLFAVNYKLPFHYQSWTSQNAWLNELSERVPRAYRIMVHPATAFRHGIGDGDLIVVESSEGGVKGRANVTECVHPEVVAIAGAFGSWAFGKPTARGKGVHFNTLLPFGEDRIDHVAAVVDSCVRVRIRRA